MITDLRDRKVVLHFEPAVIEKKWAEPLVREGADDSGWSFYDDLLIPKEQLSFPPEKVEEEYAKRAALAILAAMISHVDNLADNQRVYCKKALAKKKCDPQAAWMLIHDLGATMGGFRLSWDLRTAVTDKAQLALAMGIWQSSKTTAIFTSDKSSEVSVASVHPSQTLGPIKRVKVGEAGRRYLMSRLVALGGGVQAKNCRMKFGRIWSCSLKKYLLQGAMLSFMRTTSGG